MKPLPAILLILSVSCIIQPGCTLSFTQPFYNTSYPETFMDGGIYPPPVGFLNVSCVQESVEVKYGITNDSDSGPIHIIPMTGELTSVGALDYEQATFYSFEVVCTDASNTSSSATAQVTIHIEPVNECKPFLQNTVIVDICPYAPVGTVLLSTLSEDDPIRVFVATDGDEGPDGILNYTLSFDEGNTLNSSFFSLNKTTGRLLLARQLDPTQHSFRLRITVCDNNRNYLSCPNLNVIILSNNFSSPTSNIDTVTVSQTTKQESTVMSTTRTNPSTHEDDGGVITTNTNATTLPTTNITLTSPPLSTVEIVLIGVLGGAGILALCVCILISVFCCCYTGKKRLKYNAEAKWISNEAFQLRNLQDPSDSATANNPDDNQDSAACCIM